VVRPNFNREIGKKGERRALGGHRGNPPPRARVWGGKTVSTGEIAESEDLSKKHDGRVSDLVGRNREKHSGNKGPYRTIEKISEFPALRPTTFF